ncbi:glycosyltransferase, partial [Candidatus Gottesmanbacteria bacterium]|nr:glycosyltransferase [Candidatus Gottesmanbacteria bacterium]
ADFQHDPNDIPRFIKEFDKGADYVIGSRYISGGSIPNGWGFKRKFLSVGGNLFARATLWMWDIHDFTTGFRLARVKGFLETINFEKIFSKSYAYKMRLLYEMKRRGAKIKEIPINFAAREKGWSKMDSEDFFESLKIIWQIWKEKLLL